MTALIPNRDNNNSTTAAMPGHTRSSLWGAASPGWEIFMRLYTSAARDLFHKKFSRKKAQKAQMKKIHSSFICAFCAFLWLLLPYRAFSGKEQYDDKDFRGG